MGGMQAAMTTLANGLVEEGIEVEMYALFRLEHFFKLDERIKFSESLQSPTAYNIITRMVTLVKNVRSVARVSKAQQVIVYGKFYSALVLLATIGLGKRVFISDRASPLYRDWWYVELITKVIYFFIKPAGVIAQTTTSARYQRKRFGRKVAIKVIPNAVKDIKTYDYPKEEIVLAVGRFGDRCKGFDRLIEVWGLVHGAENWRLVFAGGLESEEPEYGIRAKELGVYDRIDFLGKVSNMDEYYSKSSLFVIPSRSEGFPNALAEAMCAGMCCVAFDFTAGARDLIEDGVNGVIVPDDDIHAMARVIEGLIADSKTRVTLAKKASKSSEIFSKEVIVNKIINFIWR